MLYIPRFFVTQAVYDAASPCERLKYNYVVDEQLLSLPKSFNFPVLENLAESSIVNEAIINQ